MKLVISWIAALIHRAPGPIILVVMAFTFMFGVFSGLVEPVLGNEGFAPDNPEIKAAEELGEVFADTSESVMQVVVESDTGDVITAAAYSAIQDVVTAVHESEAGGNLSDAPERGSIFHYLTPVDFALAATGQSSDNLTDDQLKQIYAEALSQMPPEQRGFVEQLLSQDADVDNVTAPAGLMLIFLVPPEPTGDLDADFDAQTALDAEVANAVRSVDTTGGVALSPFSFALLFEDQGDFDAEIGRLFAMAAGIILIILLFVYWLRPRNQSRLISVRRTVTDVLLTLATIFLAIAWMNGIGWILLEFGLINSFNQLTQIVPILLIGLGVDYGIHLTSRYREEVGDGRSIDGGIDRAIRTVGVALALATVTTMIGFLTNIFNPIPALKDFGILAATGILASFVLMLTFVPSVRVILDRIGQRRGTIPAAAMAQTGERFLPKIMATTAVLAEKAAIPVLILALALGAGGVYGFTQLDTTFSITDFLPEGSETVETLNTIQEQFGGGFGESTSVLVKADDLATPDIWNGMLQAQNNLVDVPDVQVFAGFAQAESPVSVVIQTAMASEDFAQQVGALGLQADFTVSADADVMGIYDALFVVAPDAAGRVLAVDGGTYGTAQVIIQTSAGESGAAALATNVNEAYQPVRDAGGTAIATSNDIVTAVILDEISRSQQNSILIAVAVAGLVLIINFLIENRRPFLGVLTILPVALVVAWTYGLMFLTGISLNPVTSILAALAIGIGVPYTIHVARRFEEDRIRFDSIDDALRSTARHTGGALAGSAFTTVAGFGILVTSSLKPFQQMGQMVAYAIGLSLVASVLVLPSLLKLWEGYHRRRGHTVVEQATEPVG